MVKINKKQSFSNYLYRSTDTLTPKGIKEDWENEIIEFVKQNVINYRYKLSKMTPEEINEHYNNLYNAHLKTGMSNKYFKSPNHLAQLEETARGLEEGTFSKYVTEASNWSRGNSAEPEMDIVGQTSHTLGLTKRKIKIKKIINKSNIIDPGSAPGALDALNATFKVSEELFDRDVNKKDPTAGPTNINKSKSAPGEEILQIKKTKTGQPGDLIKINPKLNVAKGGTDADISPEHKGKVGTTT